MKKVKFLTIVIAILLALAGLIACNTPKDETPVTREIVVTSEVALVVGESAEINATVTNYDQDPVFDYQSSNVEVAKV